MFKSSRLLRPVRTAFTSSRLHHNQLLSQIKYNEVSTSYLRCLHRASPLQMPIKTTSPYDYNDDWFSKIWRKLGLRGIPKHRLNIGSIYIYESCTDSIDVQKFFEYCKLPDTFVSWFLITELHVWMVMTRVMLEGKEGQKSRNAIVERLWEDSNYRLEKLARISSSVRKEGMKNLSDHFKAMIFSYDEGLLTDDKTLASALWRNLFTFEDVEPVILDMMTNYVRIQIDHLALMERDFLLIDGRIKWKKFDPLYP